MSSYIWGGNDPDQKEVDLGVENKFVYDKALGRWVIPGEPLEPEPKSPAPAAPPPPPPPPGGYVNQGSPPPSAVPGGHGEFDASTLLVARAHPVLVHFIHFTIYIRHQFQKRKNQNQSKLIRIGNLVL